MDIAKLISPSATETLSLTELISRLQQQEAIDAILLAGSTGQETFKPYSDYDLLIVLNEMSKPPSLIITTINGYLTELYFLTASDADQIIQNPQTIEANTLHGAFVSMITKGKIVHDVSGRLAKLHQIAPQTQCDSILDHQVYAAWYSVTYNHAQNLRYFHSGDSLYWEALQCRLLYCISNCLTAYFTLRKMPWRGEKEAIRTLRKHDPDFLTQFQATIMAGGIEQQFPKYEQLVAQTLPAGMPQWPASYTVVQPQAELTPEDINQRVKLWEEWVKSPGDP
ncbi:nucleotidyltransferase domain-containing protein [Candidatus Leptofilum sp.]|uniref:nucleotidyltransferase domain-containing protein n=1 Tax=Candidatus Leptofilum sp. TaxID=3241576 RepID=UPI003B5C2DAF